MVDYRLQDYWILVSAFRRGDNDALVGLEMMAVNFDKAGDLAEAFVGARR